MRPLPVLQPDQVETFGTELEHLDWIDEFVANVKPYVRVRPEDGVLIKMPTEAFQLNRQGLTLMNRAMQGEKARAIALSVRQMVYHHLAQGELAGEKYLVSY